MSNLNATTTSERTRMNFSVNAKGFVTPDITSEYPSPAETAENLEKALDLFEGICAKKGYQILKVALTE